MRVRQIRDLVEEAGSPLTTRELAEITGMSQTFIRNEIRSGELQAVALGRGKKRVFRILFAEAQRYVRQLGLL
jgi:excisionase family DNA binding protein